MTASKTARETARERLAALVPHAGGMCLLDEVAFFDETHVSCRSASHRRADHPLRRDGALAPLHLLEYAAQATAVHAGLMTGEPAAADSAKYLAAVRDFDLHVACLDDVSAELRIDAERLLILGDSAMYRFQVSADGRLLAAGRLSIVAPGDP